MLPQNIVRKIDYRIMIWAWLMFFSLDLDRTNISQANTDNFLGDLKMTTDDFNLGNTLFKVGSGAVLSYNEVQQIFSRCASLQPNCRLNWCQSVSVSSLATQGWRLFTYMCRP
jgi:hypothetical protein